MYSRNLGQGASPSVRPWLVVGFAMAVFLFLSYIYYPSVIFKQEVLLYGTDPYYHVRRIWLTALHFPRLSEFDWYVNYPTGAYIQWPPGFDYLLAGLVRAFTGPEPSLYQAGVVSVWVVPLLGVLIVPLVYRMAAVHFGRWAGVLAAALTALSFPLLNSSTMSRVDHHMLEPLFLALIWHLFERSYTLGDSRRAVFAGISLAFSFLFVPVSNLFPFLMFGFFVLMMLGGMYAGRDMSLLGRLGSLFLLSAGVVALPLSLTSHFARAGLFDISPLSLFQPSVTLLLGAASAMLWTIQAWWLRSGFSRLHLTAGVVALLVLSIVLLVFTPLNQGLDFLVRTDPIAATVSETQSPLTWGWFDFLMYSSWIILLVPALVPWVLLRWARNIDRERMGLLAYMLVATTVLGLMQIRLMPLLYVALPVAAGGAMHNLLAPEGGLNSVFFVRRRALMLLTRILILVLPFAMMLVTINKSYNVKEGSPNRLLTLMDSLLWIRDRTPEPGHFHDPSQKPAYGVLSDWSFGHYISFYSERPNISNPFGWGETHRGGVVAVSRFYLEEDEVRAADMLEQLGVRYVLMIEPNYTSHALYADQYFPFSDSVESEDEESTKEVVFSVMGSRMYYSDGSAVNIGGINVDALSRLRLVYESKYYTDLKANEEYYFSIAKVFEFVPGARISGACSVGSDVTATVDVQTNRERKFIYHNRAVCGQDGRYSLTLPYPTEGGPYDTGALGPYILEAAGKRVHLDIDEQQVLRGEQLFVNLL